MNEELTTNKKLKKTVNPDINIATDPVYSNKEIDKLIYRLKINNDPTIATKLMKNFLSEDYK